MPAAKKSKTHTSKQAKQKKAVSANDSSLLTGKYTKQTKLLNKKSSLLHGSWQMNAGIFLLLVIATIALYSSDLHLGFFSVDDENYVIKNPWIKGFNFQNIIHILTTPYFLNYSPFHLFSYMLDYSFNGADPFIFHLSSNIWAGVVAGFVFLTALALTGKHIIAILSAILFVVHPAHVEAIAWISSRKDLVAAAFALPSLLAYLKYRKGGSYSTRWYLLSLFLFLLALAGKVSVATFPAVFLAIDLFIEKRPLIRSLVDKIPFIMVTVAIAMVVYAAQPISGNNPSFYVFSIAFAKSLFLLTGFGKYVIYRLRPEDAGIGLQITSVIFLLLLFGAPLLLRKRMPIVTVSIYWILFALIPAQLLSFVHPVTDRYLFFPSVATAILFSWGVIKLSEKFQMNRVPAVSVLLIIAIIWGRNTLKYLSEWNDPRSVWFAAMDKSSDPDVPYSLGGHYVEIAGRLGITPRGTRLTKEEQRKIATILWSEDKRLSGLLSEWDKDQHGGAMEKEFQNYLWILAWNNFELASKTKGTHVFPILYYKRGLLLLDRGNLQEAKKEFLVSLEEASLSSVEETRDELIVNSHNALGTISWRESNYKVAANWFKMAEEEQSRFGGNWVADISEKRQRMENMVSMISGNTAKTIDPQAAYNLGLYYFDAAGQLGTAPRIKFSLESSEHMADEVWSGNSQLQALKAEWDKGQHGGPAEKAFQDQLRKLAWDAFEQSLKVKGNSVIPNLFFRRGMLLGESGNLPGAKKEFLAALEEAAKEKDIKVKQEITVVSHDALGVIAWTARDYKEALNWFKIGEEEQIKFGGSWVPDISKKRQQMQSMIESNAGK